MWSLALTTLAHDRGKLVTALVGVVFSIVLVNTQGGLFLGFVMRASLLVDHSRADIWVGHKHMHNVDFPSDIPRRWLSRIRGLPGVHRADPYLVGWADMALPSGGYESVVVVGVDPGGMLGNVWNVQQGTPEAILQNDAIIIDRCEVEKLEGIRLGEVREIGGRRARVVGMSEGIIGFLVAPYVFTTYDRAAAYTRKPADRCSYFLVKLDPDADLRQTCAAIRHRLPDAEALPTAEYASTSLDFWMTRTGLGISFGAATLLGLLVGMVMVSQTLYAMVLDRLGEFGTFKAIGAQESQIVTILLVQATTMTLFGTAIGLGVVSAIQYAFSTPRAPIIIPWWLSAGSFVLVLAICLASAYLPYMRIRKVDPLTVLQS